VYCIFSPFFLSRGPNSILTASKKDQVEAEAEAIFRQIRSLIAQSRDESLTASLGLGDLIAEPRQSVGSIMQKISLQTETDIGPLWKFIGFSIRRSLEKIARPETVRLNVRIGGIKY
jgi:hypothetical protein